MIKIFLCVILTVTIGTSMAIVCTKDFCTYSSCTGPITEADCKPGQIFKPNGGLCGCCNSCVRALQYGESCANRFRGSPPTAECTPPLVCKETDTSSTAVCTFPASPPFVPPNFEPSNEGCQASASSYASAD